MLYERARQLKSNGLSVAEIRQTLHAEGASEEDIKVILGSIGEGPQPQPDPTQQPLAFVRRITESRALRFAAGALGALALAGLLYVLWLVAKVVMAIIEAFGQGR